MRLARGPKVPIGVKAKAEALYNHESMSEHLTNVMKKQELLLCLLFGSLILFDSLCSSRPPNVGHGEHATFGVPEVNSTH